MIQPVKADVIGKKIAQMNWAIFLRVKSGAFESVYENPRNRAAPQKSAWRSKKEKAHRAVGLLNTGAGCRT